MKEIFLEEVDSTNLYGKSNLDSLDDRTVIHALSQTSGRGRFTRAWKNLGAGNLFLSFVLKPSNDFRSVYSNLTQYLSVVLCNILESYGITPQIKWPNDVLVRGRKISGILLEKGAGDYIIAGIGVNVKHAPELVGKNYRSISLSEIGVDIERLDFLELYLSCFDELFALWAENGFESLRQAWLNMAIGLGEEITVVQEQTEKRGIFSGVDADGLLLLERNGNIEKICAGDVFFKENKNI